MQRPAANGNSSQAVSHLVGPEVSACGCCSQYPPIPSPPTPPSRTLAWDGPRAASKVPQPHLGRSAGGGSAPSQSPGSLPPRSPSESVCLSGPPSLRAPSSSCSSGGAGHSLVFHLPGCSSQFPSRRQRAKAAAARSSISAAAAALRLERAPG